MSINAINSISVYEYYYTINKNRKNQKIAALNQEKSKVGATEEQEKKSQSAEQKKSEVQIPKEQRPWADLMYQLGLSFSEDPKDDVNAIKGALEKLLYGVSDTELEQEVKDLNSYVEKLYLSFAQGGIISGTYALQNELDNISTLNKADLVEQVENQRNDTR